LESNFQKIWLTKKHLASQVFFFYDLVSQYIGFAFGGTSEILSSKVKSSRPPNKSTKNLTTIFLAEL